MIYALIIAILATGIFEGLMDSFNFHYIGVNDFFNPDYSWRNKWKDGNPQKGERFFMSSTLLVFLTDGWHLMKWLRNRSFDTTILLSLLLVDFSLFHALLFVIAFRLINGIGFWLGYK